MQNVTPEHRRDNFSAIDAVAIDFCFCGPARVEIRPFLFGGNDADGRRQEGVERALKFQSGERRLRAETADLAKRVHTRICAACS